MNKNKRSVKPILLTILAIIVAASILVPIPYYIERPGVPTHLNELVTVNGEQDEAEGSYSLTSVAIYQATVFQALKSKFEPFADLLSEKELFGDATGEEYNLEFDSQNDKNALGIGSLVVFLVEKVRTIFVFSFVLKCFSFFFEE